MTDNQPFSLPVRVYIEDTDAGGIVFYANYLKYFERARTEFLRSKGFELRAGMEDGVNYVVHSLEVKYRQPAKLDDQLNVFASVEKLGRTFLLFRQWVANEKEQILVEGLVKIACINLDTQKPRALPAELLGKLKQNQLA